MDSMKAQTLLERLLWVGQCLRALWEDGQEKRLGRITSKVNPSLIAFQCFNRILEM